MAKTFAQKVSDARLMTAGIRAHLEELKSVTLGEEQCVAIEKIVAEMQELDTKQERLKSDLKQCTAQLDERTKVFTDIMQDAKKRVKLTIAQAGWQEFGISDKK